MFLVSVEVQELSSLIPHIAYTCTTNTLSTKSTPSTHTTTFHTLPHLQLGTAWAIAFLSPSALVSGSDSMVRFRSRVSADSGARSASRAQSLPNDYLAQNQGGGHQAGRISI